MNRSLASAALAAVVALGLGACSNGSDSSAKDDHSGHSMSGSTSSASSSGAHNDADVAFVQGMVPHHQQAIEMSDAVLAKEGLDPQVKELAERIKAAQGPEIEKMKSWLSSWGAAQGNSAHAGHEGMDGMMTEADMEKLRAADATAAKTLFLEGMVMHHEGAVTMAEKEVKDGKDPAAIELAKTIIADQKKEIDEMKGLLGQ